MNRIYTFIEAEKTTHDVAFLCRLFNVARSSFYAWRSAAKARIARRAADDALAHEITVLHVASRQTYGVPRIHADTPGTKLVGDITYLPTAEGWLYLACWLDLATREVVGYAMADHHRASLVIDALEMAHGRAALQPGCIAHSDRGSEYTSADVRRATGGLGIRRSCGRTGSCFDNAAAESFWALLKEEIGTRLWPDRATARAEVFTFIETFYNRRRLRKHKMLDYLTPAGTRQRQQHALAA
ncbi:MULTISPECIES: IS3 family transposase [Streptomyces]|uniref:Transposase n=1 Tax=Streptomyces alboflavus TaxID=67267 RepID=A0A1Z1WLV3_9ACTN|nr:IS3 family transposase [Streptomyces alboflavus]ARX87426.1 transposase [Streptomyces alboflavus]